MYCSYLGQILLLLLLIGVSLRNFFLWPSIDVFGRLVENNDCKGVSIVTVVQNDSKFDKNSLSSWIMSSSVEEIVIIGWNLSIPFRRKVSQVLRRFPDNSIKYLLVENEEFSDEPSALNLALSLVTCPNVARLHGQSRLPSREYFALNPLRVGEFRSSLANFPAHNSLIPTPILIFFHFSDALRIGGFDERLKSTGWSDLDFCKRLSLIATHRPLHINKRSGFNQSNHIIIHSHVDLTVSAIGSWSKLSPKSKVSFPENAVVVRRRWQPADVVELVSSFLATQHLSAKFLHQFFSESYLHQQSSWAHLILLERLLNGPTGTKLVIHAKHGLGNRMRAVASAVALAKACQRQLFVIWDPDEHLHALFSDLFFSKGVNVFDQFDEQMIPKSRFVRYNYFEWETGGKKGEKIDCNLSKDIYVKSSFVLSSTFVENMEEAVNRELRTFLQVNAIVGKLVDSIAIPHCVGAHIRMEDRVHVDVQGLSESEIEVMAEASSHRRRCHYKHFVEAIETLGNDPQYAASCVFVAIDRKEELDVLARRMPNHNLIYLNASVASDNGRDVDALQHALADLVLLSRTKFLLTSDWSSFSEVASRMGGQPTQSGCQQI